MAAIKEAGQSLIGEDLAPGPLTPSPGTGTRLTVPAGACTSDAVIKAVQTMIGTTADGKWGPASQTALKADGRTFKDLAPNCSGNVPFYSSSGLTTAPPTTTTPGTTPGTAPKPPLLGSMGNLTSSPVFWALALAAGIGGYLYLSKPQKGKRGSQR